MKTMFWNNFNHCKIFGIRQIITIDMWTPDRKDNPLGANPSEPELRATIRNIKDTLIAKGISSEMAVFQLDNEPAKYKVPMGIYCNWANIIYNELGGSYKLYVGSDECSYTDWYVNILSNCNCDGIAYHLQNCAKDVASTNKCIEFIYHLMVTYNLESLCSEGNYLDPQYSYTYDIVLHHIKKCIEIGSSDYCFIFLHLKNTPGYEWLSAKYNDTIRGHYNEYLALCREFREVNRMVDQKDYNIPQVIMDFINTVGLKEQPNYNPYLPILTSMFFQNDNYYHQKTQNITKGDFDAFLERLMEFITGEELNIYYDENGLWRSTANRELITKSNPK
jgi:hypothetical protein